MSIVGNGNEIIVRIGFFWWELRILCYVLEVLMEYEFMRFENIWIYEVWIWVFEYMRYDNVDL